MKRFKDLAIFIIIGLFLISIPLIALAAEQVIYVGENEIIEGNFIKVAGTIDINGPVNGDVIVAGSSITINAAVAGDVIAAGNTIRIKGPVGGSIRVAGNSIDIEKDVARNVWAFGSTVRIAKEVNVGWDFLGAGANIELKGKIGRNVWASGANVVIANEVGGSLESEVGEAGQLVLYEGAVVKGGVVYRSLNEDQLIIKEGAVIDGEVTKKELFLPAEQKINKGIGQVFYFLKIVSFFALLVIGLVLVSLVPKILLQAEEKMIKKPVVSIGWGFIYLIAVPVLAVLLMFTIIGFPLALMIVPIYLITLYICKAIAGFVIGLLIFNKLAKEEKYKGSLIWPMVFGLILVFVATGLPFIGWLIKLLLIVWALGALMEIKREVLKEYR